MIAELVKHLAAGVVRDGDAVQVTEEPKPGRIDVAVQVAPDDYGRVIGRSGQTINAIRQVAEFVGQREGKAVTVDVVEPAGRPRGGGHGRGD